MNIQITFLGTQSGIPSKEKGTTSIALKRKGEILLFDCGESCQQKIRKVKNLSSSKISKIFISHYHSDHLIGLPSLIKDIRLNSNHQLKIFSPKNGGKINDLLNVFKDEIKSNLKINKLKNGSKIKNNNYTIKTFNTNHTSQSIGFVFTEKKKNINVEKTKKIGLKPGKDYGKLKKGEEVKLNNKVIKPNEVIDEKELKIVYTSDTKPIKKIEKVSKNADVLIHDSTYLDKDKNKAEKYKHSTSKQAARIAKNANVNKLILTHLSQRYDDIGNFEKEAKEIFNNSIVVKDLDTININF